MENKTPTAEEFMNRPFGQKLGTQELMIEFAKLHVENFTKSGLNLKEYLELHVK